jgi:integrase
MAGSAKGELVCVQCRLPLHFRLTQNRLKRATKGEKVARNRRFQHGSIFKRGKREKVWVGRWYEEITRPDGGLDQIRRSEILGTVAELPTRRQAEQVLNTRLRRINSGDFRPQSSLSFSDFVENRWMPEVFPTLKFSSKKHYGYIFNIHLLPTLGEMQLRLITRDVVQNLLAAKLRSGLSWKTVKHIRTTLGTILGAAECNGLIETNPVASTRLPRRGPSLERPSVSPEHIRTLLHNLPEPSRSIGWLIVLTGLRIGEVLALRWRDVDLVGGALRVNQTVYDGHFDEPKTKRSKRVVPLAKKAKAVLEALKPSVPNPDALVFSARNGSPLSRRNLLNRHLVPTCKAFALPRMNWHWLRHAHTTFLDSVGTPLGAMQDMLGHSSPEMTRSVYLHSVPEDARRSVAKVEKLVIGPKRTQVPVRPENGSSLIQ